MQNILFTNLLVQGQVGVHFYQPSVNFHQSWASGLALVSSTFSDSQGPRNCPPPPPPLNRRSSLAIVFCWLQHQIGSFIFLSFIRLIHYLRIYIHFLVFPLYFLPFCMCLLNLKYSQPVRFNKHFQVQYLDQKQNKTKNKIKQKQNKTTNSVKTGTK